MNEGELSPLEKKKRPLFTYHLFMCMWECIHACMCICVLCMCENSHSCTHVSIQGRKRWMFFSFSFSLFLWGTVSPGAPLLTWLETDKPQTLLSQPVPYPDLELQSWAGHLACCVGAGIWTPILMIVQQAFFFLNIIIYWFFVNFALCASIPLISQSFYICSPPL